MATNDIIQDFQHEFRRHRQLAERAIVQLDDDAFFRRSDQQVNPVALIVKHLAGNLRSRWAGFPSNDGDMPSRNRDDEFVIGADDSRSHLMAQWETGWSALDDPLQSLKPSDLQKIILMRGEPHSVQQALLRGLSHVAYHTGQILYLVRLWKPDSAWLTIHQGEVEATKHRTGTLEGREGSGVN